MDSLKGLPPAVTRVISLLVGANVLVWVGVAVVLKFYPAMISPAVLSYTLGLRHALDADHISAIDLMTRRLIASGQRPVTYIGGIVGTSVSAAFLILLCLGNGWVLYRLVSRLRQVLREPDPHHPEAEGEDEDHAAMNLQLEGAGFMANVFRKLFRIVDRPWKMYPLGVLFGLGFDTSSEIAILGIASIQGAQGTSLWVILIFPLLFTAGMCLLDTTDGALMMSLYTSKAFARDTVAILYYSIVLTGITVVVSAFIGIVQVLSLVQNVAEPQGEFWDGLSAISDNFEIIGGSICGLFLVVGLGSVVLYKPWRRRMDRRRAHAQRVASDPSGDEAGGFRDDDPSDAAVITSELLEPLDSPVQAPPPPGGFDSKKGAAARVSERPGSPSLMH
ncbi:peptide transporter ptr2 [Apiospora arundinis]